MRLNVSGRMIRRLNDRGRRCSQDCHRWMENGRDRDCCVVPMRRGTGARHLGCRAEGNTLGARLTGRVMVAVYLRSH